MDQLEMLKMQHDQLMANMPPDMHHVAADCPFCNESLMCGPDQEDPAEELDPMEEMDSEDAQLDSHERGEVDTYTQEQFDAAVESATAPILAELNDLKNAQAAVEVDAQVAAVKAEADAQVQALQAELDAAELKASDAERVLAETLAFLESVKAEAEAAELASAREAERIEIIKTNTSFSDDYIAKRIGDWAMLDDEAFELKLEEWKELSTASHDVEGSDVAAETAMKTVRKDAPAKSSFISRIRNIDTAAADAGRSVRSL